MLNKLEELRTKPKQVRSAYAFWTALGVTACIALVWGHGVSSRITGQKAQVLEAAAEQKDVPSSLSRFLGDAKEQLSNALASLKTETSYEKEEAFPSAPVETLDLNAMAASSSFQKQKERMLERQEASSLDAI